MSPPISEKITVARVVPTLVIVSSLVSKFCMRRAISASKTAMDKRVKFSNCVHEFYKTGVRVGKTNPFNDDVTRSVDNCGFVKTLGNINPDYVHIQHPFGHYSDYCGSKPVCR